MDEQEDVSRTIWEPVLALLHRKFGDDAFDARRAQDAIKAEKITASLPHTLRDIVHNDERQFARAFPGALQPILQTQIPSEDRKSLLAIEKRKDRNSRNVYKVTATARGEVKADAAIFVEAPTTEFSNPAPVAPRSAERDEAEEVSL